MYNFKMDDFVTYYLIINKIPNGMFTVSAMKS